MFKLVRYIPTVIFLVLFLTSSYLHILWVLNEDGLPLSPLVYIFFALALVSSIIFLRLTSTVTLWLAFLLWLIASLLALLSSINYSEPLFRLSLICFLIGLVYSVIESIQNDKIQK